MRIKKLILKQDNPPLSPLIRGEGVTDFQEWTTFLTETDFCSRNVFTNAAPTGLDS